MFLRAVSKPTVDEAIRAAWRKGEDAAVKLGNKTYQPQW